MRTKSPTKTTLSPAASAVLNIPELLEQILYFVIITSPPDPSNSCKTANILRATSSRWAGLIDSSPTLSTLAFRSRKPSTNPHGELCIPFLQSLKYELSEIDQIRVYQGHMMGYKELQQFISAQKKSTPIFLKVRETLGLPRYSPSTTKYLLTDMLLTQPPLPDTVNTYIYFTGWGSTKWKDALQKFCRPGDLQNMGYSIEFKYWYKVTNCSGGSGDITVADVVNALTKALATFYGFKGGYFEVLHIELTVGNSRHETSASASVDYMYRWYLWNPGRFGGRKDLFDVAIWIVEHTLAAGLYLVTVGPDPIRRRVQKWLGARGGTTF
ncbi:hypothetical protein TWF281_001505 [Arthrobotrys megalospora]